jgi:UDP-N-acetylmuramyl tripeptide synthase
MQQLLAGIADRGADAACIEASLVGLARGGLEWVDIDVAIMTNISGQSIKENSRSAPCSHLLLLSYH